MELGMLATSLSQILQETQSHQNGQTITQELNVEVPLTLLAQLKLQLPQTDKNFDNLNFII